MNLYLDQNRIQVQDQNQVRVRIRVWPQVQDWVQIRVCPQVQDRIRIRVRPQVQDRVGFVNMVLNQLLIPIFICENGYLEFIF